ncbi:MAG: hypothetical protein QOE22_179 [Candidatus Parcubacteria bacterium]|jgi:hypothetical protein|nr:hypothetical protein [Candidatus Parcubacteria bacterium]
MISSKPWSTSYIKRKIADTMERGASATRPICDGDLGGSAEAVAQSATVVGRALAVLGQKNSAQRL